MNFVSYKCIHIITSRGYADFWQTICHNACTSLNTSCCYKNLSNWKIRISVVFREILQLCPNLNIFSWLLVFFLMSKISSWMPELVTSLCSVTRIGTSFSPFCLVEFLCVFFVFFYFNIYRFISGHLNERAQTLLEQASLICVGYAVYVGTCLLTFRGSLSLPSSRLYPWIWDRWAVPKWR